LFTGSTALRFTFFQETLTELLEVVPLEVRGKMWFQHDGAPAHCIDVVCEYLDETFGSPS
jgi:hypothetical protein